MKFKEYLKESEQEVISKIKEFFKKNPKPSDDEVHDFAEEMGIDTHKFEEYIYMIMGSMVKEDKVKGGKADKKKPEDFNQKELKMGIEIEMEHTDDPELAKEIAMDHLTEIPDYYTRLVKMEKEAEKE